MREPYVVRMPAVSIRSLTSSRLPCSGPPFAGAGSTSVISACQRSLIGRPVPNEPGEGLPCGGTGRFLRTTFEEGGSWERYAPWFDTRSELGERRSRARDQRDHLDLDLRALDRERRDLDERARGPRVAEDLLTNGIDARAVGDVGEEDRHLDDVAEAGARRRQHLADVAEHLTRLGDGVVTADQASVRVDRHTARDEEQVARADGIGVVADRLRLPVDAILLTLAHLGCDDRRPWSRSSSASTTSAPSCSRPACTGGRSSARARCST